MPTVRRPVLTLRHAPAPRSSAPPGASYLAVFSTLADHPSDASDKRIVAGAFGGAGVGSAGGAGAGPSSESDSDLARLHCKGCPIHAPYSVCVAPEVSLF